VASEPSECIEPFRFFFAHIHRIEHYAPNDPRFAEFKNTVQAMNPKTFLEKLSLVQDWIDRTLSEHILLSFRYFSVSIEFASVLLARQRARWDRGKSAVLRCCGRRGDHRTGLVVAALPNYSSA